MRDPYPVVDSVAAVLASPDVLVALRRVVDRLAQSLDLLRVGVAIDGPDPNWLRVLEAYGDGSGPAEQGGGRMPRAGSVNGRVVAAGIHHANFALQTEPPGGESAFVEERLLRSAGASAYCCVPARFDGRVLGTLNVALRSAPADPVAALECLSEFGDLLGAVLERDRLAAEVLRLTAALRSRNEVLDAELDRVQAVRPVARSPAFRAALAAVGQAAAVDLPVLLLGETGTGKEVLARHLHRVGPRSDGPFVAVDCASLPDGLAESELFGVRRGAFTGAERDRRGMFEAASGGSLFLDEVGDLPLTTQAKLLRAVQERQFTPLGATAVIHVDVRVIAATHRDLRAMVAAGSFREDLYHRLAGLPIRVPPLAERREDIPELVEQFVRAACVRMQRQPPPISQSLMRALLQRPFPGNVRELRNLIERALVFSGEILVLPADELPAIGGAELRGTADASDDWPTLADAQIEHIRATLLRTAGRIYGPNGAAALLGLPPSTLKSRMARLGMA